MKRRDFIKQGALWVPSLFAIGKARGQAFTFRDPAFVRKSSPASAACTLWKSQTVNNDYWGGSVDRYQSQKIKNDSGSAITICQVDFWFLNGASANDVYVKARTGYDNTGSDIGSASATVNVASSYNDWITFTWASGNPSISAGTDFFIGYYASQSFTARVASDTSAPNGQYYEDTTYSFFSSATNYTESDMIFRIYVQ